MTTRTRKAPTGPKHDRCIGHVEHAYPAKGLLCFGDVIGRDGMIAFADHLAETRADRRAARAVVPDRPESWTIGVGKARRLRPIGREGGHDLVPHVCIGDGADGGCHAFSVHAHSVGADVRTLRQTTDAGLAELVARYAEMRGRPAPVNVEPAAIVEPVKAAPVRKARAVTPAAERAAARAAILAANPVDRSRCWHFLHTSGVEPIRCTVEPDMHDGPHDYGIVAEPDTYAAAVELAETRPDPCAECGHPRHGATCATCDETAIARKAAAYPGWAGWVVESRCHVPAPEPVQAPAEPIAEPETIAAAPAPVQRPTCERCGQVFRVKGAGAEWHRVNRPDCARVAVAV